MPEGPSIIILKEQASEFIGKKIFSVDGNSKLDIQRLKGEKVIALKSWGKHFLICLRDDLTVRIHFLLFGSYSIDVKAELKKTRLGLHFKTGSLYFYACSVKFIEEYLDEVYDWSGDVMNDRWSTTKARNKLKALPRTLVCDALLDQNIFAGVGNIIKNEVCYRIYVHPESRVGALPPRKLAELIREARNYSLDFLKWKKQYVLRKHWLAHTKKTCIRCNLPIIKSYSGKTQRRTFYCNNCQILYR
jgi:endonuclease VIII